MKLVAAAVLALALAWAALIFSGAVVPAGLVRVGWVVAAFAAIAAVASWRALARRRERQRLESMRDSALW